MIIEITARSFKGVPLTKVRVFNFLFQAIGKKELDLSAPDTVSDLMNYLSQTYGSKVDKWLWRGDGKDRTLIAGTMILVNGKHVYHLQGLETHLKDDDIVSIFPPAGGG